MAEQDPQTLSLFVFIDALGWEIVQRYSFLEEVLEVQKPLETIFGYSSSCDPTFLTGKLPQEHGHLSFFVYDPPKSPFRGVRPLGLLPNFITRRGRVRRQMSKLIERYYGFTGYFQIYNMPFRYLPLFDYTERKDIFQPGGINGGQPTIFDYLRQMEIPFHLTDWRVPEDGRIEALDNALQKGGFGFAYLFLGHLDAVLHQYGTQASQVEDKIRVYEERLRHLLSKAEEQYDQVRLFVFSDHGMTDIVDNCDLVTRIDGLGLEFGRDYAAMYDSTMARFWFLRPGARDSIVTALQAEGRGRILSESELAAYGCNFPDQRYGELFYLMDPGVLICPSFMGQQTLAGMHGFAPEDRDSQAAFMTNTQLETAPGRLDAIYGIMLEEARRLEAATV